MYIEIRNAKQNFQEPGDLKNTRDRANYFDAFSFNTRVELIHFDFYQHLLWCLHKTCFHFENRGLLNFSSQQQNVDYFGNYVLSLKMIRRLDESRNSVPMKINLQGPHKYVRIFVNIWLSTKFRIVRVRACKHRHVKLLNYIEE